ncbi:hypothetical protein [Hymenobacter sp. BT730]|uniref:hypothetical protein n=1 Tax=Hymenobacter sp. BT730 TaxID=3063332 RepID=UPI0026DFE183|nr:hypothetical protein [Hymenobacter sp. BT730]
MNNKNKSVMTDAQIRIKFRDGIRGVRDKMAFLIEARTWLPLPLFAESLEWIRRQPNLLIALHPPFPEDTQILGAYRTYEPTSLRREMEWAKLIIVSHSKKLQQFICLREAIQQYVLQGEFIDAKENLNILRSNLGVSFWWIKHNLAVSQVSEGIESQKKFATEIKNDFGNWNINGYIVHQISVRNEPSVTPSRFTFQLEEEIEQFPFPKSWKQALKYHVIGGRYGALDDAIHVLRHSLAESAIDLYEALLHVARTVASQSSLTKESAIVLSVLQELQTVIKDTRVEKLIFILNEKDSIPLEEHDLHGYNSLMFNETPSACLGALRKNPIQIGDYAIAAITNQQSSNKFAISSQLISALSSVFSGDSEIDNNAAEIDRIAIAFPGFEVISALKAVSERQLSAIPIGYHDGNTARMNSEVHNRESRLMYAFSPMIGYHPFLLRFLPEKVANKINSVYLKINKPNGTEFRLSDEKLIYNGKDYHALELAKSKAIECLASGMFSEAIELAESLKTCGVNSYEVEAIRLISFTLIEKNEILKCVNFVSDEYINNPKIHHFLPIKELADKVDKSLRREMRSDISLAILYEIYSRHIDGAYERLLRPAVSGVIQGNEALRPSELRKFESTFVIQKLIYFLRYTCLPDIIYMTGGYTSTEELLEERILVLEWLKKLDPTNQKDYQDEIINLTRRIVLAARRIEVEQSKIELNFAGLIKEAEKSTKESYDRYLAYNEAGLKSETVANIQSGPSKSATPQLPSPLPIDEVSELFKLIIRDLTNIFTKDKTYGLDGFLRTRIRHNVLESELRSPLVANRLVTSRDVQGNYRFNDYWLGELKIVEMEKANLLNTVLSKFALQYDSLIVEINEEWVRIRHGNSEKGLIHVGLDDNQIATVEGWLASRVTAFDDFAQTIFFLCANSIEPGLTAIRERLADEAKQRALALIDRLEGELQAINCAPAALINSIRDVRGSVPRAFDRVIAWFNTAYEISNEPLPLNDVVQISIEMVQHFNPRFNAIFNSKSNNIIIPGLAINIITDIFVVFFHNVIIHAGLGEDPSIHIGYSEVNGVPRFELINLLGEEIDTLFLKQKMQMMMNRINDDTYQEKLGNGAGTGLYTVFQTINEGMFFDPKLSIKVGDDKTFNVSFSLPNFLNQNENTSN